MRPIHVIHNSGVIRTRITLAADEVRLKFPGRTYNPAYWLRDAVRHRDFAFKAAQALRDHVESDVTLRGRFYPAGDGLRVSLFNGNSRWKGHYYFGPDFTLTEEFE